MNLFPVFAKFLIFLEVKFSDKFGLEWPNVDFNWIIIFFLFQQASRGSFKKLKKCIIVFRDVMQVVFWVYHCGRTTTMGVFFFVIGLFD